jgi:broad specificity phosphatase PhoE
MLRARRTAEAVLAAHPQLGRIRIDRDLLEVRTAWEGEPLEALERINWDFYTNPRHPQDESLRAIHDRMLRWLGRMLRRHPGSEVLGVSHGDPILILVGTLSGRALDPRKIFPQPYIQPGVLYRMRFDAAGTCQGIQLLVPHAEAAA